MPIWNRIYQWGWEIEGNDDKGYECSEGCDGKRHHRLIRSTFLSELCCLPMFWNGTWMIGHVPFVFLGFLSHCRQLLLVWWFHRVPLLHVEWDEGSWWWLVVGSRHQHLFLSIILEPQVFLLRTCGYRGQLLPLNLSPPSVVFFLATSRFKKVLLGVLKRSHNQVLLVFVYI